MGPTSDKLINGVHKPDIAKGKPDPSDFDGVKDLAAAYRKTNNLPADAHVPVDAVTRSASGLDPHISPMNAGLQAARVAQARGMSVDDVKALIAQNTAGPLARLSRRAGGQRADAEPGAGQGPPHAGGPGEIMVGATRLV